MTIEILGTTMGNDQEFVDMIAFVEKHQLRPMVDSIRPFSKMVESFPDITKSNKVGKIVFQV